MLWGGCLVWVLVPLWRGCLFFFSDFLSVSLFKEEMKSEFRLRKPVRESPFLLSREEQKTLMILFSIK